MKFGVILKENIDPEFENQYLDYDRLKKLIKELEEMEFGVQDDGLNMRSLTLPRPTNSAAQPIEASHESNQEGFFHLLDQEMKKIENFTKKKVQEIRLVIAEVERQIPTQKSASTEALVDTLKVRLEKAGEDFLKLEKYVNLNITGFHKILKKHDRRLPNPCKNFYMGRLREQSWIRGDYSDVIVSLSRAFGCLRGDDKPEEKETEKQAFVRSTRKYWVHTEDISRVKYIILQHLPVFLQKTMAGETDSQLVNSVYLDNVLMELYQGRLDKSPGAIALRLRWYGTGTPELVFVERKTHRESWTGEVSVKERFTIPETQVLSLLSGNFNVEEEKEKLIRKKKSDEDIAEWYELVQEITQAINSKQLIPTVRTQYMRTAFQIPFDASVRVSLDTNLLMITERTKEQLNGTRWYRDPTSPVPASEITRLPYAVLEIKLQLLNEDDTPSWVSGLIESGMLMEVHKFSKFIHGCAVLLHDEVRAVPYWIDDVTLASNIIQSGAGALLENASNQLHELLPHDEVGDRKAPHKTPVPRSSSQRPPSTVVNYGGVSSYQQGAIDARQPDSYFCRDSDCVTQSCDWAHAADIAHVTQQKVSSRFISSNAVMISPYLITIPFATLPYYLISYRLNQSYSSRMKELL
jgi:SPX domain protein involved in polyphosphate accumulation